MKIPRILTGTMRTVTACYRLVAHRILPRRVPVARHFKVVVPGIREDNLGKPLANSPVRFTVGVCDSDYNSTSLILVSRFSTEISLGKMNYLRALNLRISTFN